MQHPNFSMPSNGSANPDLERVIEALRTQGSFGRAQLAWLMHNAYRWGYEQRDTEDRGYWAGYWARVAEENSTSPDDKVFFAGDTIRGVNQRAYRAACDRHARVPRLGDHSGGPASWDENITDQAAA